MVWREWNGPEPFASIVVTGQYILLSLLRRLRHHTTGYTLEADHPHRPKGLHPGRMDGEEEELPVQEAVQPLKEPPGNWSVSSFSFERMERHRKLTVAPLEEDEATSAADGEPRLAQPPGPVPHQSLKKPQKKEDTVCSCYLLALRSPLQMKTPAVDGPGSPPKLDSLMQHCVDILSAPRRMRVRPASCERPLWPIQTSRRL